MLSAIMNIANNLFFCTIKSSRGHITVVCQEICGRIFSVKGMEEYFLLSAGSSDLHLQRQLKQYVNPVGKRTFGSIKK